jgi:hypothetical protein
MQQHHRFGILALPIVIAIVPACSDTPDVDEDLEVRDDRATIEDGFELGPTGLTRIEQQSALFTTSRMSGADMQYRRESTGNAPLPTAAERRAEFVTQRRATAAALIARRGTEAVTDDDFVRVTVSVAGQIALPGALSNLERGDRASKIKAAEEQAALLQRELIAHLRLIGGRNINSLWLGNSVQVEVPAGALDSLWERPDVLDIGVNQPVFESTFDLSLLRTGTRASSAIATGINGDPPGPNRLRMGFIEAGSNTGNWPSVGHPAFADASPSFTGRYEQVWDCNACIEDFLGICFR